MGRGTDGGCQHLPCVLRMRVDDAEPCTAQFRSTGLSQAARVHELHCNLPRPRQCKREVVPDRSLGLARSCTHCCPA